MLTIKTSWAIACLLGVAVAASAVTYTVVHTTSTDCAPKYQRYDGGKQPDVPTNDGKGYGRF
jgi:hypothetical protein